ncbi:predicted protein [Nematostella vectensis]|uniref:phosphatidylinositol 3-kinase n=1 Tax=Nematostella vectensis TaxID=45351 RepID=A7S2J3_NEMVE|nr:phosphatidylinositol 4,5-bisphosphate 3-kinase catalytic subunit beta isoform [Nematostella vectensis]EDO42011.1 predicted protein [Nematostella vectensis]|eukprot:XP_001634074.1 predicted protein [Nematostella vectensis]
MAPVSRLDMWASLSACTPVDVDCLLPTGVLIPIEVRIEATLGEIKNKLWREAASYPLFNLLKEMSSYVFVCVNLQGKQEELVDENRQLIDVRPFRPMLKLIEKKGDREEKLLSSKISVLIGKNLHEFDQMKNPEVDEFRRRYAEYVEGIAKERSKLDWEGRAMYAYPVEIEQSEETPAYVAQKLNENRRFLISVAIRNNRASMKDMHAFNVSADTFPEELLVLVLKKRGAIMGVQDFDNPKDYVLKIVGRESYLLGEYSLLRYRYISECIAQGKRPQLSLVRRVSLGVNELMDVSGKSGIQHRPPPPLPPKVESAELSLWSIETQLRVKILSADNINVGDVMMVGVRGAIYHGNEVLSDIKQTKPQSGNKPLWNEFINLNILVCDIPRMARLCLVLFGVYVKAAARRKKKNLDYIPLAWVNVTLFDFRGNLRQGPLTIHAWPVPETMPDLLNPIGTVVSNINTSTSPCLVIEFQRYANNVVYPAYDKILQLAAETTDQEIFKKTGDNELEQLRQVIDREPLAPIFELDKEFVWRARMECRDYYPHSLGRLLSCVKWNCKEDVAQMQVLLQIWPEMHPELALELLDCNYADQKVREFAVRCIEKMGDSDLMHYMLQLVQVLKYESYLDCELARFLLKRTLNNQNLGHELFWLLRAEMHNPEVSVRFGLMLEAYCRGSPAHMKSLQKQLEALNKMKTISSLLQHVDRDKRAQGLQTMKECLQQKTYQDALSRLTSPLNPSYRLKQLKVDNCKYMDSKMRPLWLDFENFDELGEPVKIIFKSGDDLRQDMLTLQLIRIMDRLWKKDGLDLEMIPYGCLSTGDHVGMIEVVTNSETIAKIQMKQMGAITGAFNKTCILDWLADRNGSKEALVEATHRFMLSCAGYCVATYVLGVGDRHSDNIMVHENGQLFHIDFGHFLGNFKNKFGIRRERVPFVLTDHFVHVITRGNDNTEGFQEFRRICEQAFLVLRRRGSLLINLFVMMLSAGIPELRSLDDIGYLRKTLNLNVSEEKALEYFNRKFNEAVDNSWKTSINWAIHNKVRDNP